ncbi:hypothetical protein FHP06_09330 [Aeromicrobium terrae]|uniref:LTD domain-containing protein n=2 Tax=Aeromicrobium terrae TaxID=2498846 RepID=A0A5C8NJG7_9ACTN|nr:hypothetical protein FHP06_09330 [Aeromicrobium terrae]
MGVVAMPSASAAPSTLVVSEVYGGGGNTGAPFQNDFIELYNAGSSAVDLSGYSVQYHSSSATGSWQVTGLPGSIGADEHFLVAEAAGAGNGDPLPTSQASGSISMSGTSGTVALVHGTAALTCGVDCTTDATVVDLVGYGTAAIHEGATAAPATSNTTSAQRNASGADTDDNGADFSTAAPTPEGDGGGSGDPEPGDLRIHDLQGDGWISPKAGEQVTNVPGIVTAVRTKGSRGFWIQDSTPDDDPATSEGVFVFGSPGNVAVGDSVLVSGKVSDFYPSGPPSSGSDLSVTEIGSPTVTVLSSGNDVPAPIVIGPTTVPGTYAPDLGGSNIEGTPVTPDRSALDFYESIEGMRVQVDDARVVGPSNKYGEQFVTTKPDKAASYRGGAVLLGENLIPSGRLEVVANDGANLGLDVGDVLQGATVGPIDYSDFGGYLVAAQTVGTVQHNHLPRVTASAQTARQLAVATYNVENLAPSDSDSKYAALAEGVVENLASPDVVALEEVQDNTGATDDGVVDATDTLTKLTAAISAAGGPDYEWRSVDPVNDKDGGQPGGNIRVAFLFNPKRVSFVDSGSSTVDRSTTGTQVQKHVFALPTLSLSPGRIDPTNPVWRDSRKPLVGEFRFRGKPVYVIANHFNSKGGDQNADGRYQYPEQSSATQRAGQALVVHRFVEQLKAASKQARVVVLGDLNDYQFSPTLSVLRTGKADGTGTPILNDLITTLPADQQYTYIFNGVSQVLDHILVTPNLKKVQYQVVHVNAEYHDQVSDHDPQVVRITP